MLYLNDLLFLLPEIYWCLVVVGVLLFGTFATAFTKKILVDSLGVFTGFTLIILFYVYWQLPAFDYMLLNYQYSMDSFSYFFRLIAIVLVMVVLSLSLAYFFFERVYFIEYFFFLGFFCLSAFFLVSANEFIFFYLSIELQALILYTLASLKRYNSFSAESSLKYFVLGALSSGILLFGISFFYGFTGLTNFYDVRFLMISLFGDSIFPGISLAVGFILSAFLFKLASAPFHLWLPDVYDGAPTPIVLFFAILPKLAVILFLVKFYFTILVDCVELWHTALFVSGLLSVLWGTFGALNQLNIKRLYAYSAIVNMGYLVVSFSYGTVENFVNTINYLIPYIISSIAIFTLILLFRKGSTFRKIKFIGDYKYYFNYSIVLACTVTLIFFSLAGVPPLAGFFTKFFLFRTIFLLDFLTNCVIFIIIVVSVITAFYYIRVVRFVFFYNIRSPLLFLPILFSGALLLIIAVAVLLLFVLIQPLALTTILLSLTSIVL